VSYKKQSVSYNKQSAACRGRSRSNIQSVECRGRRRSNIFKKKKKGVRRGSGGGHEIMLMIISLFGQLGLWYPAYADDDVMLMMIISLLGQLGL
jgi:hypothetical protein